MPNNITNINLLIFKKTSIIIKQNCRLIKNIVLKVIPYKNSFPDKFELIDNVYTIVYMD